MNHCDGDKVTEYWRLKVTEPVVRASSLANNQQH